MMQYIFDMNSEIDAKEKAIHTFSLIVRCISLILEIAKYSKLHCHMKIVTERLPIRKSPLEAHHRPGALSSSKLLARVDSIECQTLCAWLLPREHAAPRQGRSGDLETMISIEKY